MSRPCADCPFKKSSPLMGSPDWLRDVLERDAIDPLFFHSCHKTDPKADGYAGAKKKRECAGHAMMVMNDFDKTPGRDGVYESLHGLVETYLRHFLGNNEFEKMRGERIAQ